MSSSENPRARLESDRLGASGDGPATSARDPAEEPEATSNNSTPFQPPVDESRGRGLNVSLDELLTRTISSTPGSSEAQQQILESCVSSGRDSMKVDCGSPCSGSSNGGKAPC
jgi:hypothetical protein